MGGEPKVDEFYISSLIKQDVLQLYISVRYTLTVQVVKDCKQLENKTFGILFVQGLVKLLFMVGLLLLKVVVQALAHHILHDHVDVVVSFECFVELCNLLVLQFLQQHDLAADTASPVLVGQLALIVDFRRKVLVLTLFVGKLHHGIGSFT